MEARNKLRTFLFSSAGSHPYGAERAAKAFHPQEGREGLSVCKSLWLKVRKKGGGLKSPNQGRGWRTGERQSATV